jgi:hypothetical protein
MRATCPAHLLLLLLLLLDLIILKYSMKITGYEKNRK